MTFSEDSEIFNPWENPGRFCQCHRDVVRNPRRHRKSIQPTIQCIKCGAFENHLLKDLCQNCYRVKYGKVSPDSCNRCGGFGEYPECPLCGDISS